MHTETIPKEKPIGFPNNPAGCADCVIVTDNVQPTKAEPEKQFAALALTSTMTGARIDTRLLAHHLGNRHQSMFELVKIHRADFEELGLLRFQTGEPTGGRPEKFALLNEDQAYLLLTYSRNSARVRPLKIRLVKAFREARMAAEMRKTEYLPTYRELHDEIHALASGSPNEKFVHSNFNKLVNKVAGVDAGHRATAALPQQSMMIVAQAIAARTLRGAPDHRTAYQRTKLALAGLVAVTTALTLAVEDHG